MHHFLLVLVNHHCPQCQYFVVDIVSIFSINAIIDVDVVSMFSIDANIDVNVASMFFIDVFIDVTSMFSLNAFLNVIVALMLGNVAKSIDQSLKINTSPRSISQL